MRRELGSAVLLLGLLAGVLGCGRRSQAPPHWLPDAADAQHDPYGGWATVHVTGEAALPAGTAGAGPEWWLADEGEQDWEFAGEHPRPVAPRPEGQVSGEFLALTPDTLYVLTTDSTLVTVPLVQVVSARISFFDAQTSLVRGYVALAAVSTLSHGVGLLLSLPVWLASGSVAASSQARTAIKEPGDDGWQALQMYARFPQGPPPGLHTMRLHPRPLPPPPDSRRR
jgi:hypothetical protein